MRLTRLCLAGKTLQETLALLDAWRGISATEHQFAGRVFLHCTADNTSRGKCIYSQIAACHFQKPLLQGANYCSHKIPLFRQQHTGLPTVSYGSRLARGRKQAAILHSLQGHVQPTTKATQSQLRCHELRQASRALPDPQQKAADLDCNCHQNQAGVISATISNIPGISPER